MADEFFLSLSPHIPETPRHNNTLFYNWIWKIKTNLFLSKAVVYLVLFKELLNIALLPEMTLMTKLIPNQNFLLSW